MPTAPGASPRERTPGSCGGKPALFDVLDGDTHAYGIDAVSERLLGLTLAPAVRDAVATTITTVGGDRRAAAIGAILALPEASLV